MFMIVIKTERISVKSDIYKTHDAHNITLVYLIYVYVYGHKNMCINKSVYYIWLE